MNKPDRSSITPLEFREMKENGTLVTQPKFQRREVWTTPKKSYLIDTILRQMPIPPIYLRIAQSPDRRKIVREVIDGQQRITAILDFMDDKYSLSPAQTSAYGTNRYSKLSREQQDLIAQTSLMCESFHGISDAEVLEIFARVNTYSVKLNRQELLNGKYFGFFKNSAYGLAYAHIEFWRGHKIFSEDAIARMSEVELTGELMILLIAGNQHKKDTIENYYKDFNDAFPDQKKVETHFKNVLDMIGAIIGETLKQTEFRRPPFFYTLFGVIAHKMYGIQNQTKSKKLAQSLSTDEIATARDGILELSEQITGIKSGESSKGISREFANACLKSTDKLEQRNIRFKTVYDVLFGS